MGIESSVMTDNADELASAIKQKTRFLHYMINAGNDKVGGEIPLKAIEIKDRFMRSIS